VTHTIPPVSSVTPTKKSVVSSGVSSQFLRMLRLDRCAVSEQGPFKQLTNG
jgi:hypothetical protein